MIDSESSFRNGQNSETFETSSFLRKVLGSEVLPLVPRNSKLFIPHHSHTTKTYKLKSRTAKDRFNSRFPNLNLTYYTDLTRNLISKCYPKNCPTCKIPLTKGISTRENVLRCSKCNCQVSLTKDTPLEHLKIPLWTFSYIFLEAIQRSPLGLSASEIQRRLGVSKSTATLLKRRLQIFLSDLIPSIKREMVKDLKKAWKGRNLPESGDLKPFIEGKPVVHMDTLALFSASQRANGFRKRYKHKGQTASIYLTDAVALEKGKYQIGTLVHTIAIKGGPVILSSVPDQKQKTLMPLMDFIPEDSPIFSDEGMPWMERYNKNFRSINHSARANDSKRNVWARNRWSKDSINNQVAEGIQRSVKYSFLASYSYINPKYSTLYLNEYSALKGLKVYGLDRLLGRKSGLLGNVGNG
ncbi:transposase [Leptospira saintgironsiae]|uniref:transposase n=1 Tax=Leptospira saintgironsiae TaxID=2023183 RepID=UPI000F6419F1|nr:transposase [Leptospira saintgironsiae]